MAHTKLKKRMRRTGGRAPWPVHKVRVQLGADCAGLNLACAALELLGVHVDLRFVSEKRQSNSRNADAQLQYQWGCAQRPS